VPAQVGAFQGAQVTGVIGLVIQGPVGSGCGLDRRGRGGLLGGPKPGGGLLGGAEAERGVRVGPVSPVGGAFDPGIQVAAIEAERPQALVAEPGPSGHSMSTHRPSGKNGGVDHHT